MYLKLITPIFILLCISTPALAGWADFNGFAAGMTKSAAKTMGYGACRNGEGIAERSDSIYCEIPLVKRKLGTINAIKANIEFKLPKHDYVSEIHLTFEVPPDTVRSAMEVAYGKPTDDEDNFIWQRGGNETISLYKRSWRNINAYVTFKYDASVGASRKKNAHDELQKKRELKNF